MFSELLATAYPSIEVDSNLLFARDGNIYTSGGITAGIDLALALVEEDHGREIALATARIMVVFPRRPGGQSQFSAYVKYFEVRSRPERGQSARLPGAVSINPAQLNSKIEPAAAHPLNRGRGGSGFAPILSPRLRPRPATVPVHVNWRKI